MAGIDRPKRVVVLWHWLYGAIKHDSIQVVYGITLPTLTIASIICVSIIVGYEPILNHYQRSCFQYLLVFSLLAVEHFAICSWQTYLELWCSIVFFYVSQNAAPLTRWVSWNRPGIPWAAAPGAKGEDLPVADGVSGDPDRSDVVFHHVLMIRKNTTAISCFIVVSSIFAWQVIHKSWFTGAK